MSYIFHKNSKIAQYKSSKSFPMADPEKDRAVAFYFNNR